MEENQGWIKLHRKLLNKSWFNRSSVVHLFIYFLLKANHEDKKIFWNGKEEIVRRGSFITGLNTISKETGISIQTVRTGITILKSTNTITIKSTNKFSIIQIVNYDQYQTEEEKSTSKSTSKLTNNQQTTNKQLTTNNNYKNEKNEKNIISKDITKREFGNHEINEIISYFKETLNLPLLDYSEKKNRQYANLLIKKFGGVDKVKLLIQSTKANPFWSTKITSLVDLYYRAVNIISSNRSQKGGVLKL